jgi:hypothetical protein
MLLPASNDKNDCGRRADCTQMELRALTLEVAEVHATSMKRLSKVEAADDPSDGAGDE